MKSSLPDNVVNALNTVVAGVVGGSPHMAEPLGNLNFRHPNKEQREALQACVEVATELHRVTGKWEFDTVRDIFQQAAQA